MTTDHQHLSHVMHRLPALPCPECNQPLPSCAFTPNASGKARKASVFEDCLRRCETCGVGLSNNANAESIVAIYRDPLRNVPLEVREGVLETLGQSLNVLNRTNKKTHFCSENSEDAATWTVFRYLQKAGCLRSVFAEQNIGPAVCSFEEPRLLLWGVPMPLDNANGSDCAKRLIGVIDEIEHNPTSRSEPDVVLDFGEFGVIFVEVKFKSRNDVKSPDHAGWSTYLRNTVAFSDTTGVKKARLYELARNWRIGRQYADDRPFALVNLGRANLFNGEQGKLLTLFEAAVGQDERHTCHRVTWQQLMQSLTNKPRWLLRYEADRGLSVDRQDLVRPILGSRSISDCLQDLRDAHEFLTKCARETLGHAANLKSDAEWGGQAKRQRVDLTRKEKPYLIPRRLSDHNMIEVINQCATLERMLDLLEWLGGPSSGFANCLVTKLHPTTSSEHGASNIERDHDLVLRGPNGEAAYFEISDVVGENDGNRKEARDLISLGVLVGKKESPQLAQDWPSGRLFLVGSKEFSTGVLKRKPNWISHGHCHYVPTSISNSTVVIEILKGTGKRA